MSKKRPVSLTDFLIKPEGSKKQKIQEKNEEKENKANLKENTTMTVVNNTGNKADSSLFIPFDELSEKWREVLQEEKSKTYFIRLDGFLKNQYETHKNKIYPPLNEIFNAFDKCHFDNVSVVIIGQDPYHGVGQAHGLSFSVKDGVPQPPSLRNMIKLAVQDVNIKNTKKGNLENWAKQGVFMLNAVLSVRHSEANSHKDQGWEKFTDECVNQLNLKRQNVVYLLWGKPAQEKGKKIDKSKNLVLESVHPSPLSAHRGFFECQHFSKANEYLVSKGKKPIDWNL